MMLNVSIRLYFFSKEDLSILPLFSLKLSFLVLIALMMCLCISLFLRMYSLFFFSDQAVLMYLKVFWVSERSGYGFQLMSEKREYSSPIHLLLLRMGPSLDWR